MWYFGVAILVGVLFNFHIDAAVYNVLTALNSNSLFTVYEQAGASAIDFGVLGRVLSPVGL